eukprot:gene11917-14074_t
MTAHLETSADILAGVCSVSLWKDKVALEGRKHKFLNLQKGQQRIMEAMLNLRLLLHAWRMQTRQLIICRSIAKAASPAVPMAKLRSPAVPSKGNLVAELLGEWRHQNQ